MQYDLIWMIILKKSDLIQSKYMRFNLDQFFDIQNATCNFFLLILILYIHGKI